MRLLPPVPERFVVHYFEALRAAPALLEPHADADKTVTMPAAVPERFARQKTPCRTTKATYETGCSFTPWQMLHMWCGSMTMRSGGHAAVRYKVSALTGGMRRTHAPKRHTEWRTRVPVCDADCDTHLVHLTTSTSGGDEISMGAGADPGSPPPASGVVSLARRRRSCVLMRFPSSSRDGSASKRLRVTSSTTPPPASALPAALPALALTASFAT
jgi:hypothetical protein